MGLPLVLGLGGLALALLAVQSGGDESYGHHLPPDPDRESLGLDANGWDVYRVFRAGGRSPLLVALAAGSGGKYPVPGTRKGIRTLGRSGPPVHLAFVYLDGRVAEFLLTEGPSGLQWNEPSIRGRFAYDVYFYHPDAPPQGLGRESVGAVSWWMGGRGPGAGGGVTGTLGARVPTDPWGWDSPLDAAGKWKGHGEGARRVEERVEESMMGLEDTIPDPRPVYGGGGGGEEGGEEGESGTGTGTGSGSGGGGEEELWFDEVFGVWFDPDTDAVWSDEEGGLIGEEQFGLFGLGRRERIASLTRRIEKAKEKVSDLEDSADDEETDLEAVSKQIAALQDRIERWELKKDKLESKAADKMGHGGGGADEGDDEDDEYGLDDEDSDLFHGEDDDEDDADLLDDDDSFGGLDGASTEEEVLAGLDVDDMDEFDDLVRQ